MKKFTKHEDQLITAAFLHGIEIGVAVCEMKHKKRVTPRVKAMLKKEGTI